MHEEAAVADENSPAPQAVHADEPCPDEYDPAEQIEQADVLGADAKPPTSQFLQADDDCPAYFPAVQERHADWPWAGA